jgi:predicted metal-dependent hydrolase
MSEGVVEKFWRESQAWLARQIARMARYQGDTFLPRSRREFLERKEEARALVKDALADFTSRYAFRYGRVAIKNLSRNWGSCSAHGNLNFNYKLVHLPLRAAHYVVFHELCHLEHMNHSPRFWAAVAREFPDHLKIRREMRKFHP